MKVFPVGGMPDLKAQMVIRVCVTCLLRKAGGDAALAAPQKRLRARK